MIMETKTIIGDKINAIWKQFSNEECCHIPPLTVSYIPETGIIFIGLNPSLSEKDRQKIEHQNKTEKELEYYSLDKDPKHPYFKKFVDISNKTGLDWGYLDLLYMRETDQKNILDLCKNKPEFIYKQLMVTKDLIDLLISKGNSLIFVVNNTLSRNLLGKKNEGENINEKWMNFDFKKDERIGTYTYQGVPFFFTSMLSGQRALDLGSYERLIWHINFVKKSLDNANIIKTTI